MTDLRKAAEMALEALETLWDILDDIDTASDMAKENDAWYRKRVEALQKKRWDTTITTDGYKLKGGPVEALRQALAQPEQEPVAWADKVGAVIPHSHKLFQPDLLKDYTRPLYTAPVDAVNISEERVDETVKREHEPVAWIRNKAMWCTGELLLRSIGAETEIPLYTAPPKREWVGYTNEDRKRIVPMLVQSLSNHDERTMAGLLNAILIDIEQQLKEKNGG